MKVAVIGNYQIFGHEDVLYDRNYTTTAKCISNTGVYYTCKAEEFRNLINKDDRSWKILTNVCQAKNSHMQTKIRKAAITTFRDEGKPALELMETQQTDS